MQLSPFSLQIFAENSLITRTSWIKVTFTPLPSFIFAKDLVMNQVHLVYLLSSSSDETVNSAGVR